MDETSGPLIPALQNLLRHGRTDLDAYLHACFTRIAEKTQTTGIRVHLLKSHMNRPRVRDLAAKVAYNVLDYSIPRSEIREADNHYKKTGSQEQTTRLNKEAQSLFSDVGTSGEGGEALLFLMAETILGIPQAICKMPLKTNPRVHYHGVDGIHVSGVEDGRLAWYWGESKLHASVNSAISDAFKSIAPYLRGLGGDDAAETRDLQLIRSNLDLENPMLEAALKNYLDRDNPLFLKTEYRGLCLVGFDEPSYPDPETLGDERRQTLEKSIEDWVRRIDRAVTDNDLARVTIEVFCLPMPSVAEYRTSLLVQLGLAPPRSRQ